MRRLLPTLVLLLAPAIAAQDKPKDALVVLATGDVSEELAEDVTEAISFSIQKEKKLAFIPKEAVTAKLGYTGPNSPGSCLFDNECLRRVHKALKTRYFVAARLSREGAGYKISVARIADTAASDVLVAATVPDSASDVINRTRALVVESLKNPLATFVFSINEPDALIEVGGKAVEKGKKRVQVKPGMYMVKVSKEGFQPFEAKLRCEAKRQCIVPVNLLPKRKITIEDPKLPPKSNLPFILQVSGWSAAGVGAVMTGVGIAFGAQSASAQQELEDACPTPNSPCTIGRDEATQLRDDGDTGAGLFNAVGIPGMILLTGGIITAVVGHVIDDPTPDTKGKVEITPSLAPGGARIDAIIRF